MKMHGLCFLSACGRSKECNTGFVSTGIVVVDVDPDAGVSLEVDYIPFWVVRMRIVFLLGEGKDRIIIVPLK
jgi:hypothetical protein